jgi:RNA polymerase sigma factor (sigma-70 family)
LSAPLSVPFQTVYDRYAVHIWRFCASQVGVGRADDCFQESMLAALAAFPSLRDSDAVRPWLFQIAAHKAIDMHRAARRETPVADFGDAESEPPHEPSDEGLLNAVRRLPPKQRTAVGYRVVAELPYREIGVLMQTSEEAARRNVHEGLKTLRRSYAGHSRKE